MIRSEVSRIAAVVCGHSGVFFTHDDVRQTLTASMGEQPHATTITRVWESMVELGGSDLEERTRQVSPKQPVKVILAMDLETANGLLEDPGPAREECNECCSVTPIVTQPTAEAA